jgi:hypothetical protein
VRSPGFEPGFSALLASSIFSYQKAWRADVLDQAIPSLSILGKKETTGRQPHTEPTFYLKNICAF